MKSFLYTIVLVIACGEENKETNDNSGNAENTVEDCIDSADNDGDGSTDCEDSDCADDGACQDTGSTPTTDNDDAEEDTEPEDSGSNNGTTSNFSGSLHEDVNYIDWSLEQSGYHDCTALYLYTKSTEASQFTGCPNCTYQWKVDIDYSSDCYMWEDGDPNEHPIEIGVDLEQEIFYKHYNELGWDTPYDDINCNGGLIISSTENSFSVVCERRNSSLERTSTLQLDF